MKDADIVNLYFARNEDAIAESQKSYGKYCTAVAMHILAPWRMPRNASTIRG